MGLGLVVAGLGVLGAGSNGPALARYEVTGELELATGGRVFVCYAFLMTYPAEGCGGIEVHGVDFRQIPNVEAYPSGAQVSQAMRLVGTWDGKALTLAESPKPAQKAVGLPEPCVQEIGFDGAPGMNSRQIQVTDALRAHGIMVLETMPCDDTTLGVTVVVADDETISWVTSHYAPVKVAGWLGPLPSGP